MTDLARRHGSTVPMSVPNPADLAAEAAARIAGDATSAAALAAAITAERVAARNLSNVNFATTPTEGGTSLCKASGTALTAAPTSGALLLLTLVNDFNALVAKHNALLAACQAARVCI